MWISKDKYEKLMNDSEVVSGLSSHIRKLKDELADLKTQKTMEEREIKHLVKIKEEKLSLEFKVKEVELIKGFQEKEMALHTDYHDKTVKQIEGFNTRQDVFFDGIMKRLPNISANLEIKG